MADDEAEHSKTTAGSGFTPASLPDTPNETPVSGAENQPTAEPAATGLPGTQAESEAQIPVDAEALETDRAPGVAGFSPEEASTNASELAALQTKPRSRFPALAATAIIGGILGFGGTFALRHFEGPRIGGVSDDRIAELDARIDALKGKSDDASAASRMALAALETRVATAESAANKAAEIADSARAGVQKALESVPAAQEPVAGSNPAEGPDLGPLSARIGAIEQKLTSLEAALAAPKAELRAHQQDREKPVAKQDASAQAIAIVAQSLLIKLESGGQFSDELAALDNLGVPADALAPLRAVSTSLASERQLTAQFKALTPEIIASDPANQASADENFLGRVTRHAKGLVHIRRVGETGDMDIESLAARIENALADHDLEAAYKVWKELPSAAVTKSESWGEAVKARLDAFNAARSIEADAVAVLGKPKS